MNFNDLHPRLREKIYIEPNTSCWLWLGRIGSRGYPVLDLYSYDPATQKKCVPHMRTNRVMYEMYVGGIDEGLELDHLCRTPLCVNPAHLEAVTHAENMRRYQATILPKRCCSRGHLYAEGSFYWVDGSKGLERRCRICERTRQNNWRAANREHCRTWQRNYRVNGLQKLQKLMMISASRARERICRTMRVGGRERAPGRGNPPLDAICSRKPYSGVIPHHLL